MLLMLGLLLQNLSPQAMRADLAAFREVLENQHGGYDRYASRPELDALFAATEAGLSQPMDELAFYTRLWPIIALIGDGHTQLSLSGKTARALDHMPMRVPFKIKVIDHRGYLFYDYTEARKLPLGSEILAINGRPFGEILRRMMPLFSSDGRNQSLKHRRMESTFWFSLRLRMLYGPTERFDLLLRRPDGQLAELSLPGITNDQLNQRFRARYQEKNSPTPARFAVEGKLGILTLGPRAFESKSVAGIPFETFLSQTFTQMKPDMRLIIDLRGNGGGYDAWGRVLAQHLVDKPFRYYESLIARSGDGFRQVSHDNLGLHQPRTPNFAGPIYVLIDAGCFSAASETITSLHQSGRAAFLGKESGGGYAGNTSGSSGQKVLPNSGITLYLPYTRYIMDTSRVPYPAMDRGMIPDYDLGPSILDLLNDRDPVMDFARKLATR